MGKVGVQRASVLLKIVIVIMEESLEIVMGLEMELMVKACQNI